jgi:hypothetical protein
MTAINKIKAQMLVQLLRGENLICSFRWIFKPDWRSVYGINRFSLKGGEGIGKSCMYSVTVMTTKLIGVHQSKWRSASSIEKGELL